MHRANQCHHHGAMSPQPAPSIRARREGRECMLIFYCLPLTITSILLFDCYWIVFYIICIPGKYSISIGEHYCKILGLREFSLFSSLWVLVTFCRTIFTIYWAAQYFGVAQNGIIMGHFTVCQTYYYDEIENIILLLTQRLQSQPLGRQHNNKTSVQRIENRIC